MEYPAEQQFLIRECSINVKLEPSIIHIINDEELGKLLNDGVEATTDALVSLIKEAYSRLFGKALDISNASLAVEIWGHVYFEYLAKVTEEKTDWKLIKQLADKITSNCEVIDCGESQADSNRFFWDMMAPFKKTIVSLLPKQIDATKLDRNET